jgi:stage V sporulation protein SpoVS
MSKAELKPMALLRQVKAVVICRRYLLPSSSNLAMITAAATRSSF